MKSSVGVTFSYLQNIINTPFCNEMKILLWRFNDVLNHLILLWLITYKPIAFLTIELV